MHDNGIELGSQVQGTAWTRAELNLQKALANDELQGSLQQDH